MKILATTNIFHGNNKPFSIKPTIARVKIPKKHQLFEFEIFLSQASKRKEINCATRKKYLKTLKDMIITTEGTYFF